ncbi:uncharacterized protein HMPREF1541_07676 [Cyphellophora europaea CBS 101466]|uniref:Transcription factor domain-containing protein n=1 Tax=Cyphellophora europaea (strain CBS 101466) TaxID=1220924 RepID=W2RQR2_CYPE1|nr:uncharacterized protein HMPREF1541_07676 [Cyphellophora europaea CBS 101466]ETN38053.1 hypothetical protein HMPREF1541_07676 [Cyphellophora europaea CBS 101466]
MPVAEGIEATAAPNAFFQQIPGSLSIMPVSTLRASDYSLLAYYESIICPSSVFLEGISNPYRQVLLPMALQSRGMFHATLAISANTLRLSSAEYAVLALEHQRQALRHLMHLIKREDMDATSMDEVLGLVLMLCWFDISDGCRPSWTKHLKGFRGLLLHHQRLTRNSHSQSHSLERFFTQYFVFHLVLAKTTFHTDDIGLGGDSNACKGNSQQLASEPLPKTDGELDRDFSSPSAAFISAYLSSSKEINLYMGFSDALLLLINEIAELSVQTPRVIIARQIKRRLDKLVQEIPLLNGSIVVGRERIAILATAETYRIGALLFFHEVLRNSQLGSDVVNEVFKPSERAAYITSILNLVDSNPDVHHMACLPLWPLFIAGCCADDDLERVKTLMIFELMEKQQRFGNIAPARQVLEMTWRQRDLRHEETSAPSSKLAKADRGQPTRRVSPNQVALPKLALGSSMPNTYEWERILNMLGGWRISLT